MAKITIDIDSVLTNGQHLFDISISTELGKDEGMNPADFLAQLVDLELRKIVTEMADYLMGSVGKVDLVKIKH